MAWDHGCLHGIDWNATCQQYKELNYLIHRWLHFLVGVVLCGGVGAEMCSFSLDCSSQCVQDNESCIGSVATRIHCVISSCNSKVWVYRIVGSDSIRRVSGLCEACYADWQETSKGSNESKNFEIQSQSKTAVAIAAEWLQAVSCNRHIDDISSRPQSHLDWETWVWWRWSSWFESLAALWQFVFVIVCCTEGFGQQGVIFWRSALVVDCSVFLSVFSSYTVPTCCW